MLKIFLKGQRSNRTPLSYPEYIDLFKRSIRYSQGPEDADILVYSSFMDIHDEEEELQLIIAKRPDIKLVILSEEPLWDSLWSEDCFSKQGVVKVGEREVSYVFLNHWTSEIFDFEALPYFITTNNDYFARYGFLFNRNRDYNDSDLRALWDTALNQVAFYAEFQDQTEFDAGFPEYDVSGLVRFRTRVAQGVNGNGVVRVGKRWGNSTVRQLLPDWHLDKLAGLDRRSFIISGIENTHQWNYVSEKIFDAYAAIGVPLYCASSFHAVNRLVSPGSFINLYNLSVDEAVETICAFEPGTEFIENYRASQSMLADLFSRPENLVRERSRVVSEVVSELKTI